MGYLEISEKNPCYPRVIIVVLTELRWRMVALVEFEFVPLGPKEENIKQTVAKD